MHTRQVPFDDALRDDLDTAKPGDLGWIEQV